VTIPDINPLVQLLLGGTMALGLGVLVRVVGNLLDKHCPQVGKDSNESPSKSRIAVDGGDGHANEKGYERSSQPIGS